MGNSWFEIYQDKKKLWRWRLKSNQRIMASSGEGYATRWKAERAMKRIVELCRTSEPIAE